MQFTSTQDVKTTPAHMTPAVALASMREAYAAVQCTETPEAAKKAMEEYSRLRELVPSDLFVWRCAESQRGGRN